MAKSKRPKSKEDITESRAERAEARNEELREQNKPSVEARQVLADHASEKQADENKRAMKRVEDEQAEAEKGKKGKVHTLGKPGSGAGLKPGDWFAPSSNPGAAAQVPDQPLQPESLQSHGKGIIFDKDLSNPPYDTGDPLETDAGPSGTHSHSTVDKDAERKKADKATSRSRMSDPDNPTDHARGKKDATASPNPIGTTGGKKNSRAGGSNSGTEVP